MHNLRLHGDGIAECAICGAIYRIVKSAIPRDNREGFDCCMCGDRLDTLIGSGRRVYELVSSPEIGRLAKM